ncbi:MAG: OmpA family protein [Chitinispirillales bacterium]|jgi:outer membrane protein OmpA-like peptidoglycan-associated protein|nr:OmpA family protein [Chitinispirillales bacterium]
MSKSKIITILLSAFFGAAATAVAETYDKMTEIQAFDSKLDSMYSILQKEDVVTATQIYSQTKGRLNEAKKAIEKNSLNKPLGKNAQNVFMICSVSATAALLEFERELNMAEARKMSVKRDSLLMELHNLHETINLLEGSRAARLSSQLQATKAQSSQLQEDLERERLEKQQSEAEAERLKGDLEAERERARKLMEDAQKRFGELQSTLIKVSRDVRGTIISMSDILFESGKAELTADLKTSLAKIAGILIVYKDPKVVVEGHTDNTGSKELNQKLSEQRSAAVLSFLVEQGVTVERLTSKGYGFSKPVADNKTSEGRAKNRRVDLIVQDAPVGRK